MMAQNKSEIVNIFNNQIRYTRDFINSCKTNDSSYTKAREITELYTEDIYNPALYQFQDIICKKPDERLFELFINTLIEDSSSADETPSDILFEIFKCQTMFVISEYHKMSNLGRKQILLHLDLYFQEGSNNISNYNDLKKQYDSLK